MTALDGTVAIAQVDGVAAGIGEYLDLDVPRRFQESLQIHRAVAEGRLGLALGQPDGVQERGLGVHHAHAAPPTPARGLDHDRITDVAGDAQVLVGFVPQRALRSGHARYTGLFHGADRRDLVAHEPDGVRPGSDEDEAAFLHTLGEVGVLGQEAIARVDGDGIGDLGGADHRGTVQITLRGRRRPDAHRFIGESHRLEIAVGGRVHGDGLDPHLPARPEDAEGDLPAVGDHDLFEHGRIEYSVRCRHGACTDRQGPPKKYIPQKNILTTRA